MLNKYHNGMEIPENIQY